MSPFAMYGSKVLDEEALSARVAKLTGVSLEGHESSYWGLYHASWDENRQQVLKVGENYRDQDGELLEDGYPEHIAFVYVHDSPHHDEIRAVLDGIPELELLTVGQR